ncbi:hypothetical protein [Paraburkholderia terrae]|uniref:hypothetical protein n=1 Tax=Paraburkholderia terrae TaxID=311230 RepID=UPI001EE24B71|nr:hypothetical protein [Paraburkholderia terrae]GJH03956.1 hypothetical protein CBA19C8_25385 [Paraburkholderia terrae]
MILFLRTVLSSAEISIPSPLYKRRILRGNVIKNDAFNSTKNLAFFAGKTIFK